MADLLPAESFPRPPHDLSRANPLSAAPPGEDAGDSGDLREVLGLARRNLRLILAAVVVTCALAAAWTYTRAPRYSTSAVVRLADVRGSMTGGLEEQAMERLTGSVTDPVLSQIEVLRSRTLIGRSVDESGYRLRPVAFPASLVVDGFVDPAAPADTLELRFTREGYRVQGRAGTASAAYGQPVSLGGARFTVVSRPERESGQVVVAQRERAITGMLGRLTARPRERTDVVDLRFEHTDPAVAQRALNSLVQTFQAVNAERAQAVSRRRRIFLEEQLQATDSMLSAAQRELSGFRERAQVYSTRESFMAQQQSLVALDLRREELQAERTVYQNLVARLSDPRSAGDVRAMRALIANPALAANPAVAQLHQQYLRYETTRDSLLSGAHPRAATDPDVQRVESLLRSTQERIAEAVRSHLSSLDLRLAGLDQLRARHVSDIAGMPRAEAEEVRLAQQVTTVQTVADQLRQEYQRARISEAVEVGQVEVLDYAGPAVPLPQRHGLVMMMGLLAGLMLGGGAAVLREQMNTSLRRREDVERFLGLTSLAVIPRITSAAKAGHGRANGKGPTGPAVAPMLVAAAHTRSTGAEAYRTLRTNLLFSQTVQKLRTIGVTSAGPAEGKSTTSANLAATFAQQGLRVLLVDCDLRRPRLHEIFEAPREPGFTQYLLGQGTLRELARPTAVPNLFLLTAGTLPPNPAELLGSPRAREVLRLLEDQFDLVLFDTPPVLLASDAAILGSQLDGMLLVLRAAATSRTAAQQALRQLQTVGTSVLGAVLNDPEARLPAYEGYYGKYGYGYGYGHAYYGDAADEEHAPAATAGRG
ncbi:MAG TPA: polysaccharide biosynthesis tyrosine autokinase [Longimicrobium sp.]|nr:polysaccharide biosynthesis tyrosine autokinase [Longimicrobium sp.]